MSRSRFEFPRASSDGIRALFEAVRNNDLELIKGLLCQFQFDNSKIVSAEDYARGLGSPSVAEYLRNVFLESKAGKWCCILSKAIAKNKFKLARDIIRSTRLLDFDITVAFSAAISSKQPEIVQACLDYYPHLNFMHRINKPSDNTRYLQDVLAYQEKYQEPRLFGLLGTISFFLGNAPSAEQYFDQAEKNGALTPAFEWEYGRFICYNKLDFKRGSALMENNEFTVGMASDYVMHLFYKRNNIMDKAKLHLDFCHNADLIAPDMGFCHLTEANNFWAEGQVSRADYTMQRAAEMGWVQALDKHKDYFRPIYYASWDEFLHHVNDLLRNTFLPWSDIENRIDLGRRWLVVLERLRDKTEIDEFQWEAIKRFDKTAMDLGYSNVFMFMKEVGTSCRNHGEAVLVQEVFDFVDQYDLFDFVDALVVLQNAIGINPEYFGDPMITSLVTNSLADKLENGTCDFIKCFDKVVREKRKTRMFFIDFSSDVRAVGRHLHWLNSITRERGAHLLFLCEKYRRNELVSYLQGFYEITRNEARAKYTALLTYQIEHPLSDDERLLHQKKVLQASNYPNLKYAIHKYKNRFTGMSSAVKAFYIKTYTECTPSTFVSYIQVSRHWDYLEARAFYEVLKSYCETLKTNIFGLTEGELTKL